MNTAIVCLTIICVVQGGIAVAMLCLHRAALRDWADERADLLLRVSETQQQTVMRHHNANTEIFAPPAVNPDIDEDYYVSKEDLAELTARMESDDLSEPVRRQPSGY